MKKILLLVLVLIGIAMMYLGAIHTDNFMMPPFLSGFAFLVIAGLFKTRD